MLKTIKNDITSIIGIDKKNLKSKVRYNVLEVVKKQGYTRQLIEYFSRNEKVPAYLLIPDECDNNPAVLIHHQHNREHHLGKSEICGLAGNPLQAFGVELVKNGYVVLAPDSICFEERRSDTSVIGFDLWQHLNEMSYGILNGECIMKKVLEDAMNGISLLSNLEYVNNKYIGTLGHSYGGNTAMFLAALDERIKYCCASGCACTYKNRMENGVGIELASVIPNFCCKYDVEDVVSCIAPRKLLIMSAKDDKYSNDAINIVEKASKVYVDYDVIDNIEHKRYDGGHELTKERYEYIINWFKKEYKGVKKHG